MATEALLRTVIQMFDDDSLKYTLPRDDVVEIYLPTDEAGVIRIDIVDHENGCLTIGMRDFVRFSEESGAYGAEVCNRLNDKAYGKFVIDEHRDVSYYLDFPVSDTAGPSEFRQAMIFAMSTFTWIYPVVMTVRWANATVDQAFERKESGEPGTPIISDEQIRRILHGEDSKEDDGE